MLAHQSFHGELTTPRRHKRKIRLHQAAMESLESRQYLNGLFNPGFECPDVSDSLSPNPTDADWSFSGNAAIASSAYCQQNYLPSPPEGDQIAVLSDGGVVSQTNYLYPGVYRLVFQCAVSQANSFQVNIDGVDLDYVAQNDNAYHTVLTQSIDLYGGDHTFTFTGLGYSTTCIDSVSVEPGLFAPAAIPTDSGCQVNLDWSNLPSDTYNIRRSTDGFSFETLWLDGTDTFSGASAVSDITVVHDTTYYYQLVNSSGLISDAAVVTTPSQSDFSWPAPSAALLHGDTAYLTWESAASWHRVERSIDGVNYSDVYSNGTNIFYGQNFIYDVGLNLNTTYYYKVIAADGRLSGTATLTTGDSKDDAISACAIALSGTQVSISWSGAAGTCGIQKSTDGVFFTDLTIDGSADFSGGAAADADVIPGSTYFYRIVSSDGKSSADVSVDVPVDLRASVVAVSPFEIAVSWDSIPLSCFIQRSLDGVDFENVSCDGVTEFSNITSITDSGVAPGHTFYYRLKTSKNQIGDVITATTPEYVFFAPAMDTNLNYRAVISWNTVPNAIHYHVQRSTDGLNYSTLSFFGSDELAGAGAIDTTVEPGTFYIYRIVASFSMGDILSAAASGTTLAAGANPDNDSPCAFDDKHYVVLHDRTLNVPANRGLLINDGDPDRDQLLAVEETITTGNLGIVQVYADGSFQYTPAVHFSGSDTFIYHVSDGFSISSAHATVNVVETAPKPSDDQFRTRHDTELGACFLSNDYDPDRDWLTISLVPGSAVGGVVTLNDDRTFTFNPDPHTMGLASFKYALSDGILSAQATVTINVWDSKPTLRNQTENVHLGTLWTFNLANLVADADGDISPSTTFGAPNNTDGKPCFDIVLPAGLGWDAVSLSNGSTLKFTPTDPSVLSYEFKIKVSDAVQFSGEKTITLNVFNKSEGTPDLFIYHGGHSCNEDVSSNDYDVENDKLTFHLADTTESFLIVAGKGRVDFDSKGTFTFTPVAHFQDDFVFSYIANDGRENSAPVQVTLRPVNPAPAVVEDVFFVDYKNSSITGNVLINDVDDDQSADPASNGLKAILVGGTNNQKTIDGKGTLVLSSNGAFTFTAAPNYVGEVDFTYCVDDNFTPVSNTRQTMRFMVQAKETGPYDIYKTTDLNTPLNVNLLENTVGCTLSMMGDKSIDNPNLFPITVPGGIITSALADGHIVFMPAQNTHGDFYIPFTYGVSDCFYNATLVVRVKPKKPTVADDAITITRLDQNGAYTCAIGFLTSNDNLNVPGETTPKTFEILESTKYGVLRILAENLWSYTPVISIGTDSFRYAIVNSLGVASEPAVMTLNLRIPGGLVLRSDTATTPAETSVSIDALANDTMDGFFPSDQLRSTLQITQQPAHGFAAIVEGRIVYTPESGYDASRATLVTDYSGEQIPDSLAYSLTDGLGNILTATVNIYVTPKDWTPIANDDEYTIDENNELNSYPSCSFFPLGNDFDGDLNAAPDSYFPKIVDQPDHGILSVSELTGEFIYTPDLNYEGTDSFTYHFYDQGWLLSNDAAVMIHVQHVDPPSPPPTPDPGSDFYPDVKNYTSRPVDWTRNGNIVSIFPAPEDPEHPFTPDQTLDFNIIVQGPQYMIVKWTGAADSLQLTAPGMIDSSIQVSGELFVYAKGISGSLTSTAGNITAYADSIGGDISAYGNVTVKSFASGAGYSMDHSMDGKNITVDWTGTLAGKITASGLLKIDVAGDINSSYVVEAAHILSIEATKNIICNVSSSGDIDCLSAISISGNISAGGNISDIYSLTDVQGSVVAVGQIIQAIAGRDWKAGVTAQKLVHLNAGRDVSSTIAVTGDIGALIADKNLGVIAGRLISGTISSASGEINCIVAGQDSMDNYDEGGDINATISAYGNITQIQSIGYPLSGGTLAGSISSSHGDIKSISADRSITATITAYNDIQSIVAGKAQIDESVFSGSVTATHGSIESIEVFGVLQAPISAGKAIGSLKGWSITGNIAAHDNIGPIEAAKWEIDSNISSSNGNIESVSAGTDIKGSIVAYGNIGLIAGSLIADAVVAGTSAGGDISASITAQHGYITHILAFGSAPVAYEAIPYINFDTPLLSAGSASALLLNEMNFSKPMAPQLIALSDRGNITGNIASHGNITCVLAAGKISGTIAANSMSTDYGYSIWAGRNIEGNITLPQNLPATFSTAKIVSWGSICGNISVTGGITLNAFGDVSGALLASRGPVSLTTAGSVSGDITAYSTLDIQAIGNITSKRRILSSDGMTNLSSGGEVSGEECSPYSWVFADNIKITSFQGKYITMFGASSIYAGSGVTCDNGYVCLLSNGDVDLGNNNLILNNIEIVARGNIYGKALAADSFKILARQNVQGDFTCNRFMSISADQINSTVLAKTIVLDSLHDVQGAITPFGDVQSSISIHAGGNVTAELKKYFGYIDIVAGGKVAMNMQGLYGVDVTAYGYVENPSESGENNAVSIVGNITSKEGPVGIQAHGSITGNITAFCSIDLHVWGDLNGNLSTLVRTTNDGVTQTDVGGYVRAFVAGDLNGTVEAGGDVDLDVWGTITQNITAGFLSAAAAPGSLQITCNKDINNVVLTAAGSINISCLNDVKASSITASTGAVNIEANGNLVFDNALNFVGSILAHDDISLLAKNIQNVVATSSNGALSAISLSGLTLIASAAGAIDLLAKDALIAVATVTAPIDPATVVPHLGTAVSIASIDNIVIATVHDPFGDINIYGKQGVAVNINETEQAASNVVLTSLGDVGGTVNPAGHAPIVGPTPAFPYSSVITINAGGNVSNMTLSAAGNATAYNSSSITVSAGVAVSGAFKSAGALSVDAKTSITGTYAYGMAPLGDIRRDSSAQLISPGSVIANLTGHGSAEFIASDLSGTIANIDGSLQATAQSPLEYGLLSAADSLTLSVVNGGVAIPLYAGGNVSIISLGDISGPIQGHCVSIIGKASLSSALTATGNVEISLDADFKGNIVAGGNVNLVAQSAIHSITALPFTVDANPQPSASTPVQTAQNGEIITHPAFPCYAPGGAISITTRLGVSMNAYAQSGLAVYAKSSISGNFSSQSNGASVFSGVSITGAISAVGTVSVAAANASVAVNADCTALGPDGNLSVISNTKAAGHFFADQDLSIDAFNGVSGEISSGKNVSIIGGLGNISADITSALSTTLTTLGDVTGQITAGSDINITAQNIHATLLAGNNIALTGNFQDDLLRAGNNVAITSPFGGVSGNIIALNGAISITAYNTISGAFSCPGDATLASINNSLSAQLAVGGAADLFAFGNASLTGQIAGALSASSQNTLSANALTVGADASLSSYRILSAANMTVQGDLSIASTGSVFLQASAGGDANVVSLLDIYGTLSAGGKASLIAMRNIPNLSLASNSDLSAIAEGNIDHISALSSSGNVFLAAGADLFANNVGGREISAGAMANLRISNAVASQKLTLWSGKSILGNVSSLGQLNIRGDGNVSGSFFAGSSASIKIAGNFNAHLETPGVLDMTVYGNLTAINLQADSIDCMNVKGDVVGDINAQSRFGAQTSPYNALYVGGNLGANISSGGWIGEIAALGPISGVIHAQTDLARIRCANDISAVITVGQSPAPAGLIIPDDSSIPTDYPPMGAAPNDLILVHADLADAIGLADEASWNITQSHDQMTLANSAFHGDAYNSLSILESDLSTLRSEAHSELAQTSVEIECLFVSTLSENNRLWGDAEFSFGKAVADANKLINKSNSYAIGLAAEFTQTLAAAGNSVTGMAARVAREAGYLNQAESEAIAKETARRTKAASIREKEFNRAAAEVSVSLVDRVKNQIVDKVLSVLENSALLAGLFYPPMLIVSRAISISRCTIALTQAAIEGNAGPAIAELCFTAAVGVAIPYAGRMLGNAVSACAKGVASLARSAIVGAIAYAKMAAKGAGKLIGIIWRAIDCFPAGTMVLCANEDGTPQYKPIESIQPGDLVYSRDQYDPNGQLATQEVVNTFTNTAWTLMRVAVKNTDNSTQTLWATLEHPFYVENQGWKPAAALAPGDRLQSSTGQWQTVQSANLASNTTLSLSDTLGQTHLLQPDLKDSLYVMGYGLKQTQSLFAGDIVYFDNAPTTSTIHNITLTPIITLTLQDASGDYHTLTSPVNALIQTADSVWKQAQSIEYDDQIQIGDQILSVVWITSSTQATYDLTDGVGNLIGAIQSGSIDHDLGDQIAMPVVKKPTVSSITTHTTLTLTLTNPDNASITLQASPTDIFDLENEEETQKSAADLQTGDQIQIDGQTLTLQSSQSTTILALDLLNDATTHTTLQTSPDTQYYIINKGWKSAQDLQTGDQIQFQTLTVQSSDLGVDTQMTLTLEDSSNNLLTQSVNLNAVYSIQTPAGTIKKHAESLTPGDQIILEDNTLATVICATKSFQTEGISVYNLTVDAAHTYFIQDGAGSSNVWVHNAGPCKITEFGIYVYKLFKQFPGDKLAGHEILQSSWLKAHGLDALRSGNPCIALRQKAHDILTKAQRDLGLHVGPEVMMKMTAVENVKINLEIIKQNAKKIGITKDTFNKLKEVSIAFAQKIDDMI